MLNISTDEGPMITIISYYCYNTKIVSSVSVFIYDYIYIRICIQVEASRYNTAGVRRVSIYYSRKPRTYYLPRGLFFFSTYK